MRSVLVLVLCAACGGGHVAPIQSCRVASDCTEPGLPYCVDGACRACDGASACTQAAPVCTPDLWTCGPCGTDADCSGFPAAAHCATDGTCVGCIDSSQCANPAPACDATTHACRACATDDDCASAVCDRDTGACAAASHVLHASPTGADTAACSQADPCSVAHAISLVDATRTIIALAPGTYATNVAIANHTLTLHGFGAVWHPVGSGPALHIDNAAHVAIRGVEFLSDGLTAIDCAPASGAAVLELDRAELDSMIDTLSSLLVAARCNATVTRTSFFWHSANAQMIEAFASEVTFKRTHFQGGDGIGAFSGAKVHVINSVWKDVNGQEGALLGDSTSSGDVVFSTLIDSPVHCGGDMLTAPTWSWSSNILYGSGTADVTDGLACTFHYNIMVPQGATPLGTNNLRDKDPRFVDVAHDDLHLLATSPAKDTADPTMTATEDYDGLARPEGPRDDCGAFEYRP